VYGPPMSDLGNALNRLEASVDGFHSSASTFPYWTAFAFSAPTVGYIAGMLAGGGW